MCERDVFAACLKKSASWCAADYGHPKDRKLSGEVMDLLNRIFVADPEQRITLAGIQARGLRTLQHPAP